MARVFTITQGLENMGAMKTGGQGSVYKGRRMGEIITAIKLLPTPIYAESVEDKNYRDFQNEVQKLKKVNEVPNPNVVKILSSGLSETGNFPFIEMEYIDGPDLEELLAPPLDPIFTIKETVKVAEQLSHALAHCHRYEVKHGDIKSNNVKLNLNTGNYVLLDFGLAIMNDEQRRTSLRNAGAAEFMAPEQHEGSMLFESDVYSFGIVIYELLAGRVPFVLTDKSETTRNHVRLAHLEKLPPDLLTFRKETPLPNWSLEKREREMQVPEWLITMVYTCLRKKPDTRFANGMELHDFIVYHATQLSGQDKMSSPVFGKMNNDIEKEQLKQQVAQYRQQLSVLQHEIEALKSGSRNDRAFAAPLAGTYTPRESSPNAVENRFEQAPANSYVEDSKVKGSSQLWFVLLLLVILAIAVFAGYRMFYKNDTGSPASALDSTAETSPLDTSLLPPGEDPSQTLLKQQEAQAKLRKTDSLKAVQKAKLIAQKLQDSLAKATADTTVKSNVAPPVASEPKAVKKVQYMVVSKAYFYNGPDEASRRNVFVQPSNSAVINAEEEQNGFVMVSFTNTKGEVSRGWLRKKDLQQVSE